MELHMNRSTLFVEEQAPTEEQEGNRVTINVGGVRFETYVATLQNISETRLSWLTANADPQQKCLFFDRHPGAFVYILNFYRTGKLHTPSDMCGPAFEEELKFWGIDEKQMEPCCWGSFTRHREAEENLKTFEGPGFEDLHQNRPKHFSRRFSEASSYSQKAWKILDDPHSSKYAKIFSFVSCSMIILSVAGYCLSTMPTMHLKKDILGYINYVCVVFFTLECIGRIATTPDRREFLLDYNNWIDIISVVPSYLVLTLSNNWVKNLVIIRLLRVFKFFKLSYGLQVLVHTLKASSYELTLLFLMLLIPLVIFSSLIYAVESNLNEDSKFISIPTTFWWCLITMTTVGYGDLTPVTWPGRMIGSVCAIFGLLTVALPISVIGGNFSLYYEHVRARLRLPRKNRNLLQVNMHGLLRQTKNLSHRDSSKMTKKLKEKQQKCLETLMSESYEECPSISSQCLDERGSLAQMKGVFITSSDSMIPNGLNSHSQEVDDFDNSSFKYNRVVNNNNTSRLSVNERRKSWCDFITGNSEAKDRSYMKSKSVENAGGVLSDNLVSKQKVERCLTTPNSCLTTPNRETDISIVRTRPAGSVNAVGSQPGMKLSRSLCYVPLKSHSKQDILKKDLGTSTRDLGTRYDILKKDEYINIGIDANPKPNPNRNVSKDENTKHRKFSRFKSVEETKLSGSRSSAASAKGIHRRSSLRKLSAMTIKDYPKNSDPPEYPLLETIFNENHRHNNNEKVILKETSTPRKPYSKKSIIDKYKNKSFLNISAKNYDQTFEDAKKYKRKFSLGNQFLSDEELNGGDGPISILRSNTRYCNSRKVSKESMV